MGWINDMWSRKTASEICGCGDPATGQDARGNPACPNHDVAAELERHYQQHPEDRPKPVEPGNIARGIMDILHEHVNNPDNKIGEPTVEEQSRYDQQSAKQRDEDEIKSKTPGICSICLQPNSTPDTSSSAPSDHESCHRQNIKAWQALSPLVQDEPDWPNLGYTNNEATRILMGLPDAGILSPEHRNFLDQAMRTPSKEELRATYPHARTDKLGSAWAFRYAMSRLAHSPEALHNHHQHISGMIEDCPNCHETDREGINTIDWFFPGKIIDLCNPHYDYVINHSEIQATPENDALLSCPTCQLGEHKVYENDGIEYPMNSKSHQTDSPTCPACAEQRNKN